MNKIFYFPSQRQRQGTIALLIAILLLMSITAIAMADWITIDTDDDYIDTNWTAVSPAYEDTTNDAGIDDRDEIKIAKYTFDGDAIYFLMESWHGGDILSSNSMRAIAALDCNNDGDFDDPDSSTVKGDRLIIRYDYDQVMVYDGSGSNLVAVNPDWGETDGNQTEWKVPLKTLYPECRGSQSPIPLAFSIVKVENNTSTIISQSDSTYLVDNPMDFGDAPNDVQWQNNEAQCNNYDTKMPCDGPRHGLTNLHLGSNVDRDAGELADAPALADDMNYSGDPDDEDGISPSPGVVWTAGGTGSLDVSVTGGSGYLNCWIDWDRDETFATSEHVINDVAVNAGTTTLSISVPGSVTFDGPYIARCRLAPNAGEATLPTGPVWGGEVEDNDWLIQPVDLSIAMNGSDVALTWSHLSQNDSEQVYKSSSPYFDRASATVLGSACTSGNCTINDAGVVGGTPDAFYYKVYGQADVSGTTIYSTPSKEVGLFEFALIAGTN